MEKKTTYADALAEIEAILQKFDTEDFDVDTMAAQVRRATELIKLCRTKLRKAEQEVAAILAEE